MIADLLALWPLAAILAALLLAAFINAGKGPPPAT